MSAQEMSNVYKRLVIFGPLWLFHIGLCDMIKGIESHVEDFHFLDFHTNVWATQKCYILIQTTLETDI